MALSFSLPTNTVCYDISCSIILYDITFFSNQAPDTFIQKMAIPITVWGLETNKHVINQYVIIDIYIPANDIKEQEEIAEI